MRQGSVSFILNQVVEACKKPSLNAALTVGLVFGGPMLVFATFYAMKPIEGGHAALRFILTADLIYILFITTLLCRRLVQIASARRAQSAGSKLHFRLTTAFGVIALFPTVLVAVFAILSVNQALEGWFSDRVRGAVGSSLDAAQAYQKQVHQGIMEDITIFAKKLNNLTTNNFFIRSNLDQDTQLSPELTRIETQFERGLKEIYIIDNLGRIRLRGPSSYLFGYEKPTETQLLEVRDSGIVLIEDLIGNEMRALIRLSDFSNHYLYLTREVDGTLLALLEETTETAIYYNQLEAERGRLLFDFGLLYLAFALILILTATWLGLWFAERLASPVGRMAAAAQKVGAGDLDARIENIKGDDEIAMLARYFNQMTHQLKGQRDTLIKNAELAESGRRLFDSVLTSVTSGVIGLDNSRQITFLNKAAQRILNLSDGANFVDLVSVIPEFNKVVDDFCAGISVVLQHEIRLVRKGKLEILLVRIASRTNETGSAEGYVIAFEEVTDLVSAQRMAAWGDIAQRIAHEIKNPLTPIKLSAERIKRKFSPIVGSDSEQLDSMVDVIVRQTDELRKIVDEFSQFARMPEPDRETVVLNDLVKSTVLLQEAGQPDVAFKSEISSQKILIDADPAMIGRSLTNLFKNAGEAINDLDNDASIKTGEIRISLSASDKTVTLEISDNGKGLPQDRSRLFEPYVTNRPSGTGLGLSIVAKTIEEHGGIFSLIDAEPFISGAHGGAKAIIKLPRLNLLT